MADCAADRLGGHAGKPALFRKLIRDRAVGHGLPVGDGAEDLPHFFLEIRSDKMKGRSEIRLLPGKINVKPALRLREDRQFLFFSFPVQAPGKIFLPFKPQTGQAGVIRGQEHPADGGLIKGCVLHINASCCLFPYNYDTILP